LDGGLLYSTLRENLPSGVGGFQRELVEKKLWNRWRGAISGVSLWGLIKSRVSRGSNFGRGGGEERRGSLGGGGGVPAGKRGATLLWPLLDQLAEETRNERVGLVAELSLYQMKFEKVKLPSWTATPISLFSAG